MADLNKVSQDILDASRNLREIIWPHFKANATLGGEIIAVETAVTGEEFRQMIDRCTGIDQFHKLDAGGLRGIASRVQYAESDRDGRSYASFTIRLKRETGGKTEYEKRLEQLATPGTLVPFTTMQSYLDKKEDGCLIGAAAVQTRDLFGYAERYFKQLKQQEFLDEGTWVLFLVVPWAALIEEGIHLQLERPNFDPMDNCGWAGRRDFDSWLRAYPEKHPHRWAGGPER